MRAAICVLATALALAPTPVRADTVCEWMEFAERIVAAGAPALGTPRTPDHDRAQTQVALAMFEALNAIDRRYQSYLNLPAAEGSASQDATAVTAAYRVLLAHGGVRVSSRSIPNAAVQSLPSWDDWVREVSFSRTLRGVHYRSSNEAGEEIGRRVARMTLQNVMQPLPAQGRRRAR